MIARLLLATAIFSLSAAAGDPPDRIGDLVRQLGDERPEMRDEAEKALEQEGERALPELDKAAGSKDTEIASRARRILAKIRLPLDLAAPHKDRATWERIFGQVPQGCSFADAQALAGKASAFGEAGEDGWGYDAEIDARFTTWKLDGTWRLVLEAGKEETVTRVRIVGFEDLRGELKTDYDLCLAIQQSPGLHDFDPAACIHAVNKLRAAGKDRALEACHKYLALFEKDDTQSRMHGLDDHKLFPILRLLFTDADGKPFLEIPPVGKWALTLADDTPPGTFPIFVVDDIPFLVSDYEPLAGNPELPPIHISPGEQLALCGANGVLRAKPLAPSGSPVAAVDLLLAGDEWKSLEVFHEWHRDDLAQLLRIQAARALAAPDADLRDLFKRLNPVQKFTDKHRPPDPEDVWAEAREKFEGAKPRWDEAEGRFVTGK